MTEDNILRVRRICLDLPEAIEQLAWGEPTFRIRKKLFAMYANAGTHHGGGRDALWVNAPVGMQEHLVALDRLRYFVPPYVGVKGWVGIWLDIATDEEIRQLVLQSYAMVAPKKLLPLLGA